MTNHLLEGAAARIRGFGAERLRVAAMPRLAGGLLTRAVVRFKTAHPDVVLATHAGGDEAGLGASVCALVAPGLGGSVMNPLAAQEEAQVSPITIRPFEPALPVHVVPLFPPARHCSRLLRAFAACAHDVLADQGRLLPPP